MSSFVGLIPAAGRARRLGLDHQSKEVLRVGSKNGEERPVIEFLLDGLGDAGIREALVVLREGKRDIPETLAARSRPDWPNLAYVLTPGTASIPETVDCAVPFLAKRSVILGFPDVRFLPANAPADLLDAHLRAASDVTLALFPSERPDKTDMVEIGDPRTAESEVVEITGFRVKPGACDLDYTWIMAAWRPAFSDFLHATLGEPNGVQGQTLDELQMSEVFEAGRQAGLTISGRRFADGQFIDIGTPEDLERAATAAPVISSPEGGNR